MPANAQSLCAYYDDRIAVQRHICDAIPLIRTSWLASQSCVPQTVSRALVSEFDACVQVLELNVQRYYVIDVVVFHVLAVPLPVDPDIVVDNVEFYERAHVAVGSQEGL